MYIYHTTIITALFLLTTVNVFANENLEDSTTRFKRLDSGMKLSGMYQLHKADSFNLFKDTINVELFLNKIDPYYLIYSQDLDPTNLDSFINKYYLSQTSKDKYRDKMKKVINGSKSTYYRKFKLFCDEDQEIRTKYNSCIDSFSCMYLLVKMRRSDSEHAAYLYSYVRNKGWPSPSNGSYFAGVIAIHDHIHHGFYIPIVENALNKGLVDPVLLQYLIYYQKNNVGFGSYLAMLDTTRNIKIDVSSLLEYKLPDNLPEIRQILSKHCKAKTYLLFQCLENNRYIYWDQKAHYLGNANVNGHILAQFFNELRYSCRTNYPKDLWEIHWESVPYNIPKIYLYIVY